MSGKKKGASDDVRWLCRNRRARHDYSIEETVEAGVELLGSEVKSIRAGNASLGEAYVAIEAGQAYLVGARVAEWAYSHMRNHDPLRRRRLLLHRRELKRLDGKIREKGFTLIPLGFYLVKGLIKLQVGLAKGKRQYDKREAIKKRDQERDDEQERSRKPR